MANLLEGGNSGNMPSRFPTPVPSGRLLTTYPVGLFPYWSVFDGTNIWVSNNYDKNNDNNSISKLTTNGEVLGTFIVGFNPASICFDGSHIWTANGANGAGSVTKVSLDGATITSFNYPNNPIGIAFDGTSIWITQANASTITKMNLSGVQQQVVTVGSSPVNIYFDGTSLWVANGGGLMSPANTVTKVRPSDGAVLGTFVVGNHPYGICSDSIGNIYVAIGAPLGFIMTGAGAIVKISPTGTMLGTFNVSGNPYILAYDGANIWATQLTTGQVSVLNTSGTILATYPVGIYPVGICFDAFKNAYVCNMLSNTVSKLAAYSAFSLNYSLAINLVPPFIGAAVHGTPLSTSNGTWWKGPGTFTYQWEVSSTTQGFQLLPNNLYGFESIVGQTTNTYTPVVGDVGNYVRCVVTSGSVISYSNQSLVS